MDHGPPLLQERLSLNVVGNRVVSVRTTPREESVREDFSPPDPKLLLAHRLAVAEAAQVGSGSTGGYSRDPSGEGRALCVELGKAVPFLARAAEWLPQQGWSPLS